MVNSKTSEDTNLTSKFSGLDLCAGSRGRARNFDDSEKSKKIPPAVDTSIPPPSNEADADIRSTSDNTQAAHSPQQEVQTIAVSKCVMSSPSVTQTHVDSEGPPTNDCNDDNGKTVTEEALSPRTITPLSLALGCTTPNLILRKTSSASETQRRQRADNDLQPTTRTSAEVASSNSQITTRHTCSLEADQPQAGQCESMKTNTCVGNGGNVQLSSSASDAQGNTADKGTIGRTHASESSQKFATSQFIASPVIANTDIPDSEHCDPLTRQIPAFSASAKSATSFFGATFDTKKYFGRFFRGVGRYMYATNITDRNEKVAQMSNGGIDNPMPLSCNPLNAKPTKISSLEAKQVSMSISTSTFEESDATITAKGFARWRDIPDLPPIMSSLSMHSAGDDPSYHVAASRYHVRRIGLKKIDRNKNDRWSMKDMDRERKRCMYSMLKNLGIVILFLTIGLLVILMLVRGGTHLDDATDPLEHNNSSLHVGTAPTMRPKPIKFEERHIDPDEGDANKESAFAPSSVPSITSSSRPSSEPSSEPSASPSSDPLSMPSLVPSLGPSSSPTLNVDRLENDGDGRNNVVKTDSLSSNLQPGSPGSPGSPPLRSPAPTLLPSTMKSSAKALTDSPTKSPSSSSMLYSSPAGFSGLSMSFPTSHEKDYQTSGKSAYCSQMSAEDQYKSHLTKGINETTLAYLLSLDMFNLSWRMKVELGKSNQKTTERFGPENEFSNVVQMAALRTLFFWTRRGGEEESPGTSVDDAATRPRKVNIFGTHSSDVDGLVEIGLAFVSLYGKTAEEGIKEARRVIDVVETQVPGGFDNPIFTMHGFAYDAGVILGDGMLNYLQNIPVPTRVPFTIALHSRLASIIGAHLLHRDLGMPATLPSDEDTNTYQALFADVLGAYYMAHPLGGLLTGDEICTSFLAYVRSTGVDECVSSVERDAAPGIQLTSSQKSCAAIWAIRWAWVDNATSNSGSATGVASLSELKDRFDARYQRIVNVDQLGTCPELSTFECALY